MVDPGQWKVLQHGMPQVRTVLFPSAGHFPMLQPAPFLRHLRPILGYHDCAMIRTGSRLDPSRPTPGE
jgi:hypothetical protein